MQCIDRLLRHHGRAWLPITCTNWLPALLLAKCCFSKWQERYGSFGSPFREPALMAALPSCCCFKQFTNLIAYLPTPCWCSVAANCTPNWRVDVEPADSCGPYTPLPPSSNATDEAPAGGIGGRRLLAASTKSHHGFMGSHDTVSMAAIGADGKMAAGSTTNGW